MIFCAGVQHPHETPLSSVFFGNYVHVYVSSKLKEYNIFQRSALRPFQDSKTST